MSFMIKNKLGWRLGKIINPALSGVVVLDLGIWIAPYHSIYGKEAAENAGYDPVKSGNVGAGTGTSVGKFSYTKEGLDGLRLNMKAGIGSARIDLGNGLKVCAISAVNAVGNVVLSDGTILAGNRNNRKTPRFRTFEKSSELLSGKESNTTISVVGINVDLKSYENYERVASIASHGQVRAINPVNTSRDGDTVFVFSTREIKSFFSPSGKSAARKWNKLDTDIIGQAAAKAVQQSIYDACYKAETIKFDGSFGGIVPSWKDY